MVAVAAVFFLCVLMIIPRNRESARRIACQNNLRGIGRGVALDQTTRGVLPTVAIGEEGPLALAKSNEKPAPAPAGGKPTPPVVMPELICRSDPNTSKGVIAAPNSYRACVGDDPAGSNGAFAIGKIRKVDAIDAADGTSYTASFSERLIGDGATGVAGLSAYAVADAPITNRGCPANAVDWRGDAGSGLRTADWRSNLYNHFLPPGAAPSCLSADGKTAVMGTSSGHPEGVGVLLLDGSVRTYRRGVDLAVWKALATVGEPQP